MKQAVGIAVNPLRNRTLTGKGTAVGNCHTFLGITNLVPLKPAVRWSPRPRPLLVLKVYRSAEDLSADWSSLTQLTSVGGTKKGSTPWNFRCCMRVNIRRLTTWWLKIFCSAHAWTTGTMGLHMIWLHKLGDKLAHINFRINERLKTLKHQK